MAQTPMEVQTLLKEFDNVIPKDLPTKLPPIITRKLKNRDGK